MTEQELITEAQNAVSEAEWIVGRCAACWCQKFAKGRTDADFGRCIGLSTDQVYSRRRVWETFADVKTQYGSLKWSHFYVALTWEDSAECLAWADENQATVAEMKAWRRLQHGEDLTVVEDELYPVEVPEYSGSSQPVNEDADLLQPVSNVEAGQQPQPAATMAALSETQAEDVYSPYRSEASTRPQQPRDASPGEDNGDGANRDAVLIRRTCNTVTQAIKKTDDSQQFVAELLAACWREDQGGTAAAVKLFAEANPLCR